MITMVVEQNFLLGGIKKIKIGLSIGRLMCIALLIELHHSLPHNIFPICSPDKLECNMFWTLNLLPFTMTLAVIYKSILSSCKVVNILLLPL